MKLTHFAALMMALAVLAPHAGAAKMPAAVKKAPMAAKVALPKIIAFDAKEKKYYTVAWAKKHGMHNKKGDLLILMPSAKLPPGSTMSHSMQSSMKKAGADG